MAEFPWHRPYRVHRVIILMACIGLLLVFSSTPTVVSAQGGFIAYGDSVQGTLSPQSPAAFYSFSGQVDDLVTLTVIGTTPGFRPTLTLLGDTGQLAFNGGDPLTALPSDASITQRLTRAGTYLVVVGGGPVPGDFILFLSAEPPETGISVSEGSPVVIEVQPQTAQVFEVVANPLQTVFVSFTAQPADFSFTVYVRNPAGQLVATLDSSIVQNSALALAPTEGVYVLRVVPNGPTAGSVSLSIGAAPQTVTDASTEPPDPVTTEEAAPDENVPSATATQPATNACRVAVVSPVSLYAGPSTTFELIGEMLPNTFYFLEARSNLDPTALGGNSDWFGIAFESAAGETLTAWLAFTAFVIEGDCANVPTYVYEVTPEPPAATEQVAPPTTVAPTSAAATGVPTVPGPVVTAVPTSTPQPGQPTAVQAPPTATFTPSYTPTAPATATFTPSYTPTAPATATFTPSYTPTTPPPPQVAPEDARFNAPLDIPLDSTISILDFVSYPDGDREDRVRYSVTGMNNNSALSGGRARLIIAVSCFGTNTDQVQFFTNGQTYSCGQTLVDREVTADSDTGSIVITAIGGEGTYVQWVLTGTATRIN